MESTKRWREREKAWQPSRIPQDRCSTLNIETTDSKPDPSSEGGRRQATEFELELFRKDLEILQLTDEKLLLAQQLHSWRMEWGVDHKLFEKKYDQLEEENHRLAQEASQLQASLGIKAELLRKRNEEVEHLDKYLELLNGQILTLEDRMQQLGDEHQQSEERWRLERKQSEEGWESRLENLSENWRKKIGEKDAELGFIRSERDRAAEERDQFRGERDEVRRECDQAQSEVAEARLVGQKLVAKLEQALSEAARVRELDKLQREKGQLEREYSEALRLRDEQKEIITKQEDQIGRQLERIGELEQSDLLRKKIEAELESLRQTSEGRSGRLRERTIKLRKAHEQLRENGREILRLRQIEGRLDTVKESLSGLEKGLNEQFAERETLQRNLSLTQAILKAKNKALDEAESRWNQIVGEVAELRKTLSNQEAEQTQVHARIAELEQSAADDQGLIHLAKAEAERHSLIVVELRGRLDQTEEKKRKVEEDGEKLLQDKVALESELEEARHTIHSREERMAEMAEEIEGLYRESSILHKKLDEAHEDLSRTESDRLQWVGRLDNLAEQTRRIRGDWDNVRAEKEALEGQLRDARGQFDKLATEKKELEEDLSKARSELAARLEDRQKLGLELTQLRKDLQDRNKELNSWRNRLEAVDQRSTPHLQQIKVLRTQLLSEQASHEALISKVERERFRALEDLEATKREKEGLAREMEELQAAYAKARANWEQQIAEAQEALRKKETEIAVWEDHLVQLRSEHREAQSGKEADRFALETDWQNARHELSEALAARDLLASNLDDLEARYLEAQREMDLLRERVVAKDQALALERAEAARIEQEQAIERRALEQRVAFEQSLLKEREVQLEELRSQENIWRARAEQAKDLAETLGQAEAQLEEERKQLHALQQTIERADSDSSKLASEIADRDGKLRLLRNQLSETEQLLRDRDGHLSQLRDELEQLQAKEASSNQRLVEIQREHDAKLALESSRLEEERQLALTLRQEIKRLKSDAFSWEDAAKSRDARIAELNERLVALTQQSQDLEKTREDQEALQTLLDEAESERLAAANRWKSTESERLLAETRLKELERGFAEREGQLAKERADKEELIKSLHALEAEYSVVKGRLEEATHTLLKQPEPSAEIQALPDEMEALRRQLAEIGQRSEETSQALCSLQEVHREALAKREELEQALVDAKNTLRTQARLLDARAAKSGSESEVRRVNGPWRPNDRNSKGEGDARNAHPSHDLAMRRKMRGPSPLTKAVEQIHGDPSLIKEKINRLLSLVESKNQRIRELEDRATHALLDQEQHRQLRQNLREWRERMDSYRESIRDTMEQKNAEILHLRKEVESLRGGRAA